MQAMVSVMNIFITIGGLFHDYEAWEEGADRRGVMEEGGEEKEERKRRREELGKREREDVW